MATRSSSTTGTRISDDVRDELWCISRKPIIHGPINLLVSLVHQGNEVVYTMAGKRLIPTPEYAAVSKQHWFPFSKKVMMSGFVESMAAWCPILLPTGEVVPRFVPPQTTSLDVAYDPLSEERVYSVFRRNMKLRDRAFANRGIRNYHGITESEEDWVHRIPLDGIRIDLGNHIPASADHSDPLITVINSFASEPDVNGAMNSPVWNIMNDYKEYEKEAKRYSVQQNNLCDQRPYVAPKAAGDDDVRQALTSMYTPGDNNFLAKSKTADEMANHAVDELIPQLMMQRYRKERGLDCTNPAIGKLMQRMDNELEPKTDLDYHRVPAGSSVTNSSSRADSKHFPQILRNLEKRISDEFQIPLHIIEEPGKRDMGNTNFDLLRVTISRWYSTMSSILTNVYRVLNGAQDSIWYARTIRSKWLRHEATLRTIEESRIHRERVEDNAHGEPRRHANTTDRSYVDTGSGAISVVNTLTSKKKKRKRAIEVMSDSDDGDKESASGERRKRKKGKSEENKDIGTIGEQVEEYEDTLATYSETKAFNSMFQTKGVGAKNDNTTRNDGEARTQTLHTFDVELGFPKTTFMSIPQLQCLLAMGSITVEEFDDHMRGYACLPPNYTSEKSSLVKENVHRLLGSINAEAMLRDTPLAPILSMDKKQIELNEKKAVEEALRKQRIEYELREAKMKIAMQARQSTGVSCKEEEKQDSDKNKIAGKKDASAGEKTEMKKEKRKEKERSGEAAAIASAKKSKDVTDDVSMTGRQKGKSKQGQVTVAK